MMTSTLEYFELCVRAIFAVRISKDQANTTPRSFLLLLTYVQASDSDTLERPAENTQVIRVEDEREQLGATSQHVTSHIRC